MPKGIKNINTNCQDKEMDECAIENKEDQTRKDDKQIIDESCTDSCCPNSN